MLTFAQLKEILKENQIKIYSHYTKSKLIEVEIHDLETDKVDLYRSIYKAALALEKKSGSNWYV